MSVATGGAGARGRAARLAAELGEQQLDALLVQEPHDLRYITGFTGSNGAAVVLADGAREGVRSGGSAPAGVFLTDFRYTTQSEQEVAGGFTREIVTGDLLDALASVLPAPGGRLGFDETSVTVAAHRRLQERLPSGWTAVACEGLVSRLRLVKDAAEVERIRAAAALADEALTAVLAEGLTGRTERDVAIELELRMRRLGAEGPSFPSIVASGAHAALPHASPRDVEIPGGALVTIDWGALHEGYCSDCTRTYAAGAEPAPLAREVYELVLSAQLAGLAAVRAGRSGREVDAAARAVIEQGGQGEHFGHGLGHGVGMEVHEGPRLARTAGSAPLQAGNVVTVEPGVYLPGALGVRIEDLVVVTENGAEVLTSLPKELTTVD